jgi:DNA topoisomerase-3
MGVSNCPECDTGVLVLDPASIPKWKLVCNKCDVIVRLFEDAAKVSVNSEESCPECDAQLVKVDLSTFLSDLSVGLNVKNYFLCVIYSYTAHIPPA